MKGDDDDDDEKLCRICLLDEESDEYGTLISPCNCSGTSKWIHDKCLKKQMYYNAVIIQRGGMCQICKYQMKFQKRYSTSLKERAKLVYDYFSSLILIVFGYIIILYFNSEVRKKEGAHECLKFVIDLVFERSINYAKLSYISPSNESHKGKGKLYTLLMISHLFIWIDMIISGIWITHEYWEILFCLIACIVVLYNNKRSIWSMKLTQFLINDVTILNKTT
jgi:hypothetical protein